VKPQRAAAVDNRENLQCHSGTHDRFAVTYFRIRVRPVSPYIRTTY
jgi:hypothetical protein